MPPATVQTWVPTSQPHFAFAPQTSPVQQYPEAVQGRAYFLQAASASARTPATAAPPKTAPASALRRLRRGNPPASTLVMPSKRCSSVTVISKPKTASPSVASIADLASQDAAHTGMTNGKIEIGAISPKMHPPNSAQ